VMENNDSRAKELRAGGKVFHATGSGLVFRPAARVSIFGPLSGWDRARVCSYTATRLLTFVVRRRRAPDREVASQPVGRDWF